MDLVKAYWDDENFGVSSYEIKVESADSFFELSSLVNQLIMNEHSCYITIKISTNTPELLYGVASLDFVFLETSFKLGLKKRTISTQVSLIGIKMMFI